MWLTFPRTAGPLTVVLLLTRNNVDVVEVDDKFIHVTLLGLVAVFP